MFQEHILDENVSWVVTKIEKVSQLLLEKSGYEDLEKDLWFFFFCIFFLEINVHGALEKGSLVLLQTSSHGNQ
jgi:hypothetical protein